MSDASVRNHLPLRSVELDILLGVIDEPRHGYAILQEAEARSGGHPGFEIPTLYRALRRLRDAGLVAVAEPPQAAVDERREYWQATTLGQRVLEAELQRLEAIIDVGRERTGKVRAGGS